MEEVLRRGGAGDGLMWSLSWGLVVQYLKCSTHTHTQHKSNNINPDKMLLTGLWCTRSGRLGSLTQPADNPAGRVDAYWSLSSCIDVGTYYIPFPGDVTYPGAVCVCVRFWKMTLRQGVLIKLDGLQFQCKPCLYVRRVIFRQREQGQRWAAVEDCTFFRNVFTPVTFLFLNKILGSDGPRVAIEWHRLTLSRGERGSQSSHCRSDGIWGFLRETPAQYDSGKHLHKYSQMCQFARLF